MVSPIRPFKCQFISAAKQGQKHLFLDLERVCCWDGDGSRTKLIFFWCVRLKNAIFVSECSEDTCLVKNGSNMYLGNDGEKELVIATMFISPITMNGLMTASCLLKGRGIRGTCMCWARPFLSAEYCGERPGYVRLCLCRILCTSRWWHY